jgi:Tfp pilus assembly protein PilF
MKKIKRHRNKTLTDKNDKKIRSTQETIPMPVEQEKVLTIQEAIDLAVQHHNAGDLPKAEGIYQQILKADPNQPVVLHLLGVIAHQVGKNDISVDLITKALGIEPDYAEAHSNLGNVLKEIGLIDESIVSYKKALAIKPDYAEAHSNLGINLKELGQLSEAVISYRKAIDIKPDYAEAYSNLGNALQDLGKIDEAVTSYKKALAIKPDFSEVRFNLGICLLENRQYKKSAEQLKLTNFGKSKSYLLKSLYELDDQYIFYDQLDDLIRQDEVDSIIGSLCSRSEIRYGINRPNPFCNDPLKYVLKTDLIEKCDFTNVFVEIAKNILNKDTASYKNQNLLDNGYQTAGNLFLLKSDLMEEVKRILDSEIEKYRLFFKDSEEGFIKHWPKEYNLHGWIISMKSGGELHPHMHEEGWISGSVYINVPLKSKSDSGNLVVGIDSEDLGASTNKTIKKSIDVVTGSLCLFPASLLHYTIPFESEEERIVLAFDVRPK